MSSIGIDFTDLLTIFQRSLELAVHVLYPLGVITNFHSHSNRPIYTACINEV
ncbi:uncharacterized protein METZ01_LOCUS147889 [marine metagenome]|uniref:Uncharacterized protein n=1 Tax=marine metagenome TaxID=408172 RepID=A0A382A0H7_9ZZZZ